MRIIVPFSALILLAGSSIAGANDDVPTERTAITSAVEKALPYLAADGREWMDGRIEMQDGKKCVSCHYTAFGVWSHHAAAMAGLNIDRPKHDKLNADAMAFIADPKVGRTVTYSHMLLANAGSPDAKNETLNSFVQQIVRLQEKGGFWKAKGQFPSQARPVSESNAVATMWALSATKPFTQDEEIAATRTKALNWLDKSKPGKSTEWLAWRYVISNLEQQPDRSKHHTELLARQNENGGWSWLPNKTPDAMTTGQVVYALLKNDAPSEKDHRAIERAIRFLMETQQTDGRWKVASELVSKEADEYKDQIYSYWGTAWSVIAMSEFLKTEAGAASTVTKAK